MRGHLPSSITKLTELTFFTVGDSYLTNGIPSFIGNLPKLLQLGFLFNDYMSGEIPSSIGNLKNLTSINIFSNGISGTIPKTLCRLHNLIYLTLSGNNLVGSIPDSLGKLTQLQQLDLSFNHLTGGIPASLGNLKNLSTLNLGTNMMLSGNIPKKLGNLTNLTKLELYRDNLTGNIPSSLGHLTHLNTLNLSYNGLSGQVTNELIKLDSLQYLNIQFNRFTFAGLSNVSRTFPFAQYAPQANIPLYQNGNILSVYTGGAYELERDTFRWYKNGNLVATIKGDSTFSATQYGSYYVRVSNSVATALILHSDTVSYTGADNLIASKIDVTKVLSVYPNPATSLATLSFTASGRYTVKVFDNNGKIKQTVSGTGNPQQNLLNLDVSKYSPGVYFITVIDEQHNSKTLKVIKN